MEIPVMISCHKLTIYSQTLSKTNCDSAWEKPAKDTRAPAALKNGQAMMQSRTTNICNVYYYNLKLCKDLPKLSK